MYKKIYEYIYYLFKDYTNLEIILLAMFTAFLVQLRLNKDLYVIIFLWVMFF